MVATTNNGILSTPDLLLQAAHPQDMAANGGLKVTWPYNTADLVGALKILRTLWEYLKSFTRQLKIMLKELHKATGNYAQEAKHCINENERTRQLAAV